MEVKHTGHTMRINLKQQLMRQQLQEQLLREQNASHSFEIPASNQQSTEAVHITGSSSPSEVPPSVYKVLAYIVICIVIDLLTEIHV